MCVPQLWRFEICFIPQGIEQILNRVKLCRTGDREILHQKKPVIYIFRDGGGFFTQILNRSCFYEAFEVARNVMADILDIHSCTNNSLFMYVHIH